MAKKMKAPARRNGNGNGEHEDDNVVSSMSNLTGFDLAELKKGIEELMSGREDVAEANGKASGVMKRMEKELGVNSAGLKMALGLYKMTDEKRTDVLRTFHAACAAMQVNIQPTPDLVDLAEQAAAGGMH